MHMAVLTRKLGRDRRGLSIIAAMLAVLFLAALGVGIAYFTASNQQARIQQVTSEQAFYSVHAGLEYGLAKVLKENSTDTLFAVKFAGEPVAIVRSEGKMTVTATKHGARAIHSIDDPAGGGESICFIVSTVNAKLSNKQLRDIEIRKGGNCPGVIAIYAITLSWNPDSGEKVTHVQFGGDVLEYSSPPAPPKGSGSTFDFSDKPYIIGDFAKHNFNYIKWDKNMHNRNFNIVFHYTYDGKKYSTSVHLGFELFNQAYCFDWSTAGSRLGWSGYKWSFILDTTVVNQCTKQIKLTKMTVEWLPSAPSRNLNIIKIGGTTIFSGSAVSGQEFAVNYVLAPQSSQSIQYFGWDNEMLGRNYAVRWTFEDKTERETELDVFAANQNNCLNIDTGSAAVDSNDRRRITGITIENSCGMDIGMTGMMLAWNMGAMQFTGANIYDNSGANVYSWNAGSGEPVAFGDNDIYLRNEDGVQNVPYLLMSVDITPGTEFTLSFAMSDGTTKTVTFVPAFEAANLVVDVSGAKIGGVEDRDLKGITLRNTGANILILSHVKTSWVPVSAVRVIEQITIGGTTVWSGSQPTGTKIDISDIAIGPFETKQVDFLRFDGDMSERTFVTQFILTDGSVASSQSFTPPDE